MRRKPRIIHIAWVRGPESLRGCLSGKPRRKGGRLVEFCINKDRVVIFLVSLFVEADCLSALFDKEITGAQVLLIINDRSRNRFAQFELIAHFLEARSERFNLLLLLGYGRFLLCICCL